MSRPGEPASASTDAAPPRILVVDDSRVVRNAAQKMLGCEFDVVTAEDGEEAWQMLGFDPSIRVVFTDLTMPNLDGYELLRNIRNSTSADIQRLPVIVVTGVEDSDAARARVLELGATDFVSKPFATIDLLARARAHAAHQRITRQLLAQTTLDVLTGLANKAGFLDRLQQDIAYARRHQRLLTVVRLEITDFRGIFLRHGKDIGERVLMHMSRMLRASIRKEDTAGRINLGGFALSLPAGEQQGIERMVERFRAEAAELPSDVAGDARIHLNAAILRLDVAANPSAQDALDQCQAKLVSADVRVAAPTAARNTSVPAPASTPASSPSESTRAPVGAISRQPTRALRLDPILDQLDLGHTQPAVAGMPLIVKRLLPLLRLLNSTQRGQLMAWLQQVPGTTSAPLERAPLVSDLSHRRDFR
ncbi:MAG TPA: response regulator [Rudaea sp.]|nr:response regulator [Rudaea sp.]